MKNNPKEDLAGVRKIPVGGLYGNWAFTVAEIAQSVFKATGQDMGGRIIIEYGGTAEETLQNCITKAERIDHPFRGCNILWLLAWGIIEFIGLLIRKIRGMTD